MTNGIPVCIECGGPTNELNEDEDGVPCPACSERLLESLPGVFHSPWGHGIAPEEAAEESSTDMAEGSEEPHSPGAATGRGRPDMTGSFDDPREPA